MTIATDNFNRANSSTRGANWSIATGTAVTINTNQASSSGSRSLEYYNAITPGLAQYSKITLSAPLEDGGDTNAGNGPAIRIATAADTAYIVTINSQVANRFTVHRRIAGSNTELFNYRAAGPVVGDIVELRISAGYDLELYVNNVLRGAFTDTNAAKIASGQVGDFNEPFNQFQQWDNWEGGDVNLFVPSRAFTAALQHRMR